MHIEMSRNSNPKLCIMTHGVNGAKTELIKCGMAGLINYRWQIFLWLENKELKLVSKIPLLFLYMRLSNVKYRKNICASLRAAYYIKIKAKTYMELIIILPMICVDNWLVPFHQLNLANQEAFTSKQKIHFKHTCTRFYYRKCNIM